MTKHIPPALGLGSFSCPHAKCRAIAHQTWFRCFLDAFSKNEQPEVFKISEGDRDIAAGLKDESERERVTAFLERSENHSVTFRNVKTTPYTTACMENLHLSRCYSCDGFTVWINGEIFYPDTHSERSPHEDMPPDVAADFEEAALIVNKSPRGAAALLRLALQKLMPHLGQKGKNLDDDIGALVSKGLDPVIQQALDVIRVIGNNAVHPGQIDIQDNRAVAEKLFDLINVIVLTMITARKQITKMFGDLPPGAKEAIAKRDGAAG